MKELIPTDDEFDTLLSALGALEREKLTRLAVDTWLEKAKNLTDAQVFEQAFSKKTEKEVVEATQPKAKEIVENTIVLYAKLVKFRDAVRERQLHGAIEDLLK